MGQVIEAAAAFLRDEVAPRAHELDSSPEALREALAGMARLGLLALKRPAEYGGPALAEPEFRAFQVEIARASGALAFLQTQHQSAVGLIAKGDNEGLKQRLLPLMADGRALVGVGFSQLRRAGPPPMRVRESGGAMVFDGVAPWVTGWTFFPWFLAAGATETGDAAFALVPLSEGPGIEVSEPMRLATFGSTLTVRVVLKDLWVGPEDVVAVRPQGWIQHNDMLNVVLQGYFALGCAYGALDVMRSASGRRGLDGLTAAVARLTARVEELRATMDRVAAGDAAGAEPVTVRARAILLAAQASHLAVAATGGGAILADSPAQRYAREAMVYAVSAQTPDILEATLAASLGEG